MPPRLAYTVQVRFTELQRRYLVLTAVASKLTISEVIRQAVENTLRAAVVPTTPAGEPGSAPIPLAIVLQGMTDTDALDELAGQLEPESLLPLPAC